MQRRKSLDVLARVNVTVGVKGGVIGLALMIAKVDVEALVSLDAPRIAIPIVMKHVQEVVVVGVKRHANTPVQTVARLI